MSTNKPLTFVDGPAYKYSDRIPSTQWEGYRTDIIREFQARGIPYTRQWMLENHNFRAT